MLISEEIIWAAQELNLSSETPYLDAEVLLAHVLFPPAEKRVVAIETAEYRAYFAAHGERLLTLSEQERYRHYIARRKQGEPVAYLVGHKEFWSLSLNVTPDTLIPRPETELLLEILFILLPEDNTLRRVADLGTGSGALALACAKERPFWSIYATDQSMKALQVAVQNSNHVGVTSVQFFQGSWCDALPDLLFDAIISNPPYLSASEREASLKELAFEPVSALVSGLNGLYDIDKIVTGAKTRLRSGGYLLLEHGYTQASSVRNLLKKEGYTHICSYNDMAGVERVTKGCYTLVDNTV